MLKEIYHIGDLQLESLKETLTLVFHYQQLIMVDRHSFLNMLWHINLAQILNWSAENFYL